MRLWSLHPKYLDTKGIVALWREALLAKHVLEGKTKGYKNHPQLKRFKDSNDELNCINQYLSIVYDNSIERGFHFDNSKINYNFKPNLLRVTNKQLKFEMEHLLKKLKIRDSKKFNEISELQHIDTNPLFKVIEGEIEDWEII